MKKNLICLLALIAMMIWAQPMKAGQKFNINGLQIEFVNCKQYADGVVMNFTFLNTSGRDVAFKVTNFFGGQSFVIDEDGDQHQLTELIIGGQGAAGSDFRSIPQDVTLKGQIYFRHVSERHTVVKRMNLLCRVTRDGAGEKEQNLVMVDIPISPSDNTNMEGTRFTDPIVTMETKGLTIEEPNAVLRFTLTNHDRNRYDAPIREITAYDEDGNPYEGSCSITYMKLETDIPQSFIITIKNVPNTLKKFSLIRAMFDEWGHKMEWKNIAVDTVTEVPYTTTERNKKLRITNVECSPTATKVSFEYRTGTIERLDIAPTTYIMTESGKKLQIIKADGIPYSPQKLTVNPNKSVTFSLTFPPLPTGTKQFDLIESPTSSWQFFRIKVKQ